MKTDLIFWYNGECSEDYGVWSVSDSNDLITEQLMHSRNIVETTTNEFDTPYFQGIKREPLSFKMRIVFKDELTEKDIRDVCRWLNQDNYKPLYFQNMENKIYYCMPYEDITIIHNGLVQGYLDLTMRCKTYYAETPNYLSCIYDLSQNSKDGTEITLENKGDLDISPEVWIKKIGDGALRITNMSNSGRVTEFTEAKSGKGNLKFNGTVYDEELIKIGDKVYEFDTGDGIINSHIQLWQKGMLYLEGTYVNKDGVIYKCLRSNDNEIWDVAKWEKQDESNIKVDLSAWCSPARAKLVFNNEPIKDGDTITIGDNTYEFDLNDIFNAKNGNIPINIKNYTTKAKGVLRVRSNDAFGDSKITVGEKTYHVIPTSTASQILVEARTNIMSWDKVNVDYDGLRTDIINKGVLLINEKRDNTLNGIRVPYFNEEKNKNLSASNRKLFELHKLTKFSGIPMLGLGDTGKFNPVLSKIDGQIAGDKLSVFRRDATSFRIDEGSSTTDKFVVSKANGSNLAQGGIRNYNLQAKEGDIILLAKRVDEGKVNASKVKYKGKEYSEGEFEILRIKEVTETSNGSMISYHENGTIAYTLESPSKLFKQNPTSNHGINKVVYGNSVDLANGRKYLSKFNYRFVGTERMPVDEMKRIISSGDIVLGEKTAKDGVPIDVSGTIRLGGKDRFATEDKIKEYARSVENQYSSYNYMFNVILFKKQDNQITLLGGNSFTRPYQIRQGDTVEETCENIERAINGNGIDWIHYSKGTFKNEDVEAKYDKTTNTISVTANENGSEGNSIVTVVNDWEESRKQSEQGEIINQFDNNTLKGGLDPSYDNIDEIKGKRLIEYIKECLQLDNDNINFEYSSSNRNTIKITNKKYGTLGNLIPVISNCYSCDFKTIDDKFTVTLDGGKDALMNEIIPKLAQVIKENNTDLNITYDLDKKLINVVSKTTGKKSNITVSTTAMNTYWDCNKKLIGGQDGLVDGEEVYVDSENGYIESTKNVNVVDVFNNEELELVTGVNRLIVKGNCLIQFNMKYKLL